MMTASPFNKHDVKILKDNEIIVKGNRVPNGSWSLPLLDSAPHQANGMLRADKPKQELAKHLHAALGSPWHLLLFFEPFVALTSPPFQG
jgi:hypothetical protein